MIRRTLLGYVLMLVGFGRRAWAQVSQSPADSSGFSPLTKPVRIPLESVTVPWRPVSFVGEAVLAQAPPAPGRRVIIKGVLFRKVTAEGGSDLSALCVTCPHEQCGVSLVTDPERLVRMGGNAAGPPMFECGCHFSKFDAQNDGAWISGAADRGLFQFRIGAVRDGTVEITGIENEALSVV